MNDIKEEYFWNKLNPDLKKSVEELTEKHNIFSIYKKAEIIGIIFILIYFRKYLNFDSMNFFILMCIIGFFVIAIEKVMDTTKKDIEQIRTNIKNKMIVNICSCHNYCECKEDFNNFMKKTELIFLNKPFSKIKKGIRIWSK